MHYCFIRACTLSGLYSETVPCDEQSMLLEDYATVMLKCEGLE